MPRPQPTETATVCARDEASVVTLRSCDKVTPAGVRTLLEKCLKIVELNVSGCKLQAEGAKVVAGAIR